MATLELDGWGTGYAPPEEEPKSYFSELALYKSKFEAQNKMTQYYRSQLKKLAEIEQSITIFGTLSFEEEKEKQSILNKYL